MLSYSSNISLCFCRNDQKLLSVVFHVSLPQILVSSCFYILQVLEWSLLLPFQKGIWWPSSLKGTAGNVFSGRFAWLKSWLEHLSIFSFQWLLTHPSPQFRWRKAVRLFGHLGGWHSNFELLQFTTCNWGWNLYLSKIRIAFKKPLN